MPNGRRDESAWSRIYDWWRGGGGGGGAGGGLSPFAGDWWSRLTGGGGGGGGAGGSRLAAPPTNYWLSRFGQPPAQQMPGQYTPSQGFGMMPYQGIQGPYAPTRTTTPQNIPIYQRGMTLVEEALARVSELAAQQPAEPERPEVQFPGYWEAIGQQPGNYPVPQGAVQGMWGPRRPWEEWSWRTRGIPLQGNEILRVEGGRMPWGGRRREPALDPQGRRIGPLSKFGGGGRAEREGRPDAGAWQPGAWGGTF